VGASVATRRPERADLRARVVCCIFCACIDIYILCCPAVAFKNDAVKVTAETGKSRNLSSSK
jgi:hypothetical protein